MNNQTILDPSAATPTTEQIETTGAALVRRLASDPWDTVRKWLDREHAGLLERINRLCVVDNDYRLDQVHKVLPPENFRKMGYAGQGRVVSIYRGLPQGQDIRPGDWVALSPSYAQSHSKGGQTKALVNVRADDIFWSGTDEKEFFYLPAAWRKNAASVQDYVRSLTADQVCMLCDGEQSSITRNQPSIDRLARFVFDSFDREACGTYHGPDHWARVNAHGLTIARSLGIDPLLPHIFALVHDCKREDEGLDPEHGWRAAEFIRENQDGLFSFLDESQIDTLTLACELHSDGMTHTEPWIQSCWDADRLDLWRVEIEPDALFMSSEHAKSNNVIRQSRVLQTANPWRSELASIDQARAFERAG